MRFVILDHQPPKISPADDLRTQEAHFDLMFETEESTMLETIAIEQLPEPGASVAYARLPNHRKQYLDYEGAVSGDRGYVSRLASGTWSGNPLQDLVLSFDPKSKTFPGATWKIRIDESEQMLLRLV